MTAAGRYGSCTSAIVFRSLARAIGIAERGGRGQIGRTITGLVGVFSRVHDKEDGVVEEAVVEESEVEEAEVDEPEEPPQPVASRATATTTAARDPRPLTLIRFP
jgi:hypothetical protein